MRKITYANVVSTLALFIALGGASYAAVKLPKGSVGSKQLRAGAVTTAKIAKTTRAGLRGQQGPAGAAGPAGARGAAGTNGLNGTNGTNGAPGAAGPSDVYVASADNVTLPVGTKTTVASVTVPSGSYLLQAKTWLSSQAGTGVACDLVNDANGAFPTGYFDQTSTDLDLDGTAVAVGAAAFSKTTTIDLKCTAGPAAAVAIDSRVTATATGALHGTLPLALDD